MVIFLNYVYIISLVFWVGGIFFFSAIAAPSIFKTLDKNLAGNLVTSIFPKYYFMGYVCGTLALFCTIGTWLTASVPGFVQLAARVAILVAMLGLSAYTGLVLRPEALSVRTELRQADDSSPNYEELSNRFSSLHKKSVLINGLVFVLGLVILFFTSYSLRN